ncbi:MAG: glycosyltransferase family 2 protein [Alphaproteobacteria bacterium]|nr:glycosyltransferase family 2 protein [Alphaproteobacteria bacterium]
MFKNVINIEAIRKNHTSKEQILNKLSVIVPTYNRLSYLEKAVILLKQQSIEDIKFIIVDDCSTDGSVEYIEKAIKGDNRFELIKNEKNYGPSFARNRGLKSVNSEYVGFFDVDDEIPADYFEKLYQKAISSHADIVYTNYNDKEHHLKSITCEFEKYKSLENGAVWDKIYKTSLLRDNNIKFTENLYTADNLFNVEAFHFAQKIELIAEPRYSYALCDDSIGKDEKKMVKRKKDIIKVCNKIIEFAEENEFDAGTLVSLREFLKHTYDCYAEDKDFRYKLYRTLQKIDIKVKPLKTVLKYGASEYKKVTESGFFDAKYYRRHNPSLWFSHCDLLDHYLTIGWLNGKNPSLTFDGNKYLYMYPDVAKVGINPLIHFVCHGVKEKRIAFPVSKKYYENALTPRLENEYNLLKSSGYFNSIYYRLHNPSLWLSRCDMLKHYLIYGWQDGKNPSSEFNGNKYLAVYQDVEQANINPLVHYIRNGNTEGRECFPVESLASLFSKIRYALEYPIRVKEEYERLSAEIKALENMK